MKAWAVSDVHWANGRDLHLPFWEDWNRKNPLPGNFWQRIWEYPYICSRIPSSAKCLDVGGTYPFVLFPNFPDAVSVDCRDLNALDHPLHNGKWPKDRLIISDAADIDLEDDSFEYVFSVSAIEEMSDIISVIKEMLRLARHRVVITIDVSDELGVSQAQLRELEAFLNIRIPPLPSDSLTSTAPILSKFGQKRTGVYKHIRVLGVTIDARDEPRSVGILIPHWESWDFLKLCLEAVQENRNRQLAERVYVLGDAAHVEHPRSGTVYPPTAQVAYRPGPCRRGQHCRRPAGRVAPTIRLHLRRRPGLTRAPIWRCRSVQIQTAGVPGLAAVEVLLSDQPRRMAEPAAGGVQLAAGIAVACR